MTVSAHRQSAVTVALCRIGNRTRKGRIHREFAFFVEKSPWPCIIYYSISTYFIRSAIGAAAVIRLRVTVVANLTKICINDQVAANLRNTVGTAAISGSPVAVITGLSCARVHCAISTYLLGFAVLAAAITTEDIAVVTNLPFRCTDDGVTTAADIDARILIGGTDLAWLAAPAGCFA